jgi:hypothetical protein
MGEALTGEVMPAFGHSELTIKELPDELQFRLDIELGWFGRIALPILLVGLMALTMSPMFRINPIFLICCLAAILALALWMGIHIARSKRFKTTTLSVTSQRLEASGDDLAMVSFRASNRPGKITVPVAEIKTLEYASGGEDDPSGLWVSEERSKSKCILPGMNDLAASGEVS